MRHKAQTLLVLFLITTAASHAQELRSKKLEVTAVGLEWLAKKKQKLFAVETDPEKKKELSAEIAEINRLTDETFRKASDEAIFEKSEDVKNARLAVEKASLGVEEARHAVDLAKEALQNPPDASQKARIEAAEDFMKKMAELETRQKNIDAAKLALQASEQKARDVAHSKKP